LALLHCYRAKTLISEIPDDFLRLFCCRAAAIHCNFALFRQDRSAHSGFLKKSVLSC